MDALITASSFAERITACWRRSVEAVIEAGRILTEAKSALDHGQFTEMVEKALPFGPRTAQRLMAIAADPRLADPTHVSVLPPSWGTLYELTKLNDESFEQRISDGTIRPDMERTDISTIVKQEKRERTERKLAAEIEELPAGRYGVILADPEWRFEPWSRTTGMDRAADNHYPTSALEVIASRDVPSISADDCVLFLWATAPMLPHALLVLGAWGFDYKTNAVWAKDRIGTGYWFRNKHEHLLVGTKGKIPAPAMGEQWDSVMRPRHPNVHSAKPKYFRQMIEAYYPTLPKIELNAADDEEWPGWTRWGAPHREAAE